MSTELQDLCYDFNVIVFKDLIKLAFRENFENIKN